MVSIATYDPSGGGDYFAMLTAEVTSKEILLTDAKGWQKSDFPPDADFFGRIESKIAEYNHKFKFNYNICEKNNMGTTVVNSLRFRHNLKIIAVTTSNNIVSEQVLREGKSYNKNDTIAWVLRLQKMGVIKFPNTMTQGLTMLRTQLDNFGVKNTKSSTSKVTYEALQGHDDLVTCLTILVHFAKRRILNLTELKTMFPYDGMASEIESESTKKEILDRGLRDMMSKRGKGLFDKIDIQYR